MHDSVHCLEGELTFVTQMQSDPWEKQDNSYTYSTCTYKTGPSPKPRLMIWQ